MGRMPQREGPAVTRVCGRTASHNTRGQEYEVCKPDKPGTHCLALLQRSRGKVRRRQARRGLNVWRSRYRRRAGCPRSQSSQRSRDKGHPTRDPQSHGHGGLSGSPLVWCAAPNPATSNIAGTSQGWNTLLIRPCLLVTPGYAASRHSTALRGQACHATGTPVNG